MNNYLTVPQEKLELAATECVANRAELLFMVKGSNHPEDDYYCILANKENHSKVYGEGRTFIVWLFNRSLNNGHYGLTLKEALACISYQISDVQHKKEEADYVAINARYD